MLRNNIIKFFWVFISIVSCQQETIVKEPVISFLSENSGFIGGRLIVTGSNFLSDKNQISVSFDQVTVKVDSIAVDKLFVRIPENLSVGTKSFFVTIGSRRSNAVSFNVLKSYRVSTLAGNGFYGSKDGIGLEATFSQPEAITMDKKGNLFIADNFVIRKIDTQGNVSLYAGSNSYGYEDGGVGIAKFKPRIRGITIDETGNLYVADQRFIRKIDIKGNVTTLCGASNGSVFVGLYDIALVGKSIFVVDIGQIKIVDLAGNVNVLTGDGSFTSVDGPIESAKVIPFRITPDNQGNIVFTESTLANKIRRASMSQVSTLISSESLKFYGGLSSDKAGNIYVVNGHSIIKINTQGQTELVAGNEAGYQDGNNSDAKFFNPIGLFVDDNNSIYVCDTFNNRIRKITPVN